MTNQTKPIELYFWPTPNGLKITIMLEELGVPYTIRPINIRAGDQHQPEFLKISPNNKIPVIVDPEGDEGEPVSIFESGAILQYLGEKFGKLYPKTPAARAKVNEWLFWQVGGLGPMLGQNEHFNEFAPEKVPYAIEKYQVETQRLFKVLNGQLVDKEFVAGEMSIADIAIVGWVSRHERLHVDLNEYPNVKAWLDRMYARPGVARGLKVKPE